MTPDQTDNHYTKAIVRGVPGTFDRCIKPRGGEAIDVGLARRQHAQYCRTLESLGLELTRLEPDDRYPDCCFVEDTVVVGGEWAVLCRMGAAGRRGEEEAVGRLLGEMRLHRLEPPATLDGGDVILDGDRLFVGMSGRSNDHAPRRLRALLAPEGVDVVPVPVDGVLHLKSACTPLAPGLLLASESIAGAKPFAALDKLLVPRDEWYAANCLSVNGTVLVSEGFPATKALVESRGFPTRTLSMTEFRKAGGSLTCLSVLM
jgi:dimethylargininase